MDNHTLTADEMKTSLDQFYTKVGRFMDEFYSPEEVRTLLPGFDLNDYVPLRKATETGIKRGYEHFLMYGLDVGDLIKRGKVTEETKDYWMTRNGEVNSDAFMKDYSIDDKITEELQELPIKQDANVLKDYSRDVNQTYKITWYNRS